jgi:hypothetical protein
MNTYKRPNAPRRWRAPPKAANAKRDLYRRPRLEELEKRDTPSITFAAYSSVSDYTHLTGGPGVYAYNSGTSNWRYISGSLPSLITEGYDGVMYGAYSSGVWCYYYYGGSSQSGAWLRISPYIPTAMDAAPDNALAASFPTIGTWEYHVDYNYWTQMSPSPAQALAVAHNDQVYASFAGAGIFEYLSGHWYWLTGATSTTMAASPNGLGFMSFAGSTWVWSNYGGWGWVGLPSTALAAYTSPYTNYTYLCGSFNGAGTYEHNVNLGTWTYMTTATTSQIGYDNLYDIYAVYGNGLWKWNGSWTRIDSTVPYLLAA